MTIGALVLAAGFSTRMGCHKLQMPFGQKTVIEAVIDSLLPHCDAITLVTGHEAEAVEALFIGHPQVRCLRNPDPTDGMLSSFLLGLSDIHADRFFLLPGDMPCVKTDTFKALLATEGALVLPSYQMKSGHPALIDRKTLIHCSATDATDLKQFLNTLHKIYVCVEDPGILWDLDTPEDYKRYSE